MSTPSTHHSASNKQTSNDYAEGAQYSNKNTLEAILIESSHGEAIFTNNEYYQLFKLSPASQDHTHPASIQHHFTHPYQFSERTNQIKQARQPIKNELISLSPRRTLQRDYYPIELPNGELAHLWKYSDHTEQALQAYYYELQKLQNKLLLLFISDDYADTALNQVIGEMSIHLDISRVSIYQYRQNERVLDMVYEWTAPQTRTIQPLMQNMMLEELAPSFLTKLIQQDIIEATDINTLPQDIQAFFAAQNVKSALVLPLYAFNRLHGFITLTDHQDQRQWIPEEIQTIRTLINAYAKITERKQHRRDMIKAQDEALQSIQLQSNLISIINHDARAPITNILNMLTLLSETKLDPHQQELIQSAADSSQNLYNIANTLLDFSKLEALPVASIPINLHALITDISHMLEQQLATHNLFIQTEISPSLPTSISIDPTRLRQLLFHLAAHLIHQQETSFLTLHISINNANQQTFMQFSLRAAATDNQPSAYLTHPNITTEIHNTISKYLAESIGGYIDFSSNQEVNFIFPILLEKSNTLIRNFASLRALVIDNDQLSRYVLAQQLRAWGLNVIENQDLEHGLEVTHGKVDVVFWRPQLPFSDPAQRVLNRKNQYPIEKWVRVQDEPLPAHNQHPLFNASLPYPIRQTDLHQILASIIPEQTITPASSKNRPRILLCADNPATYRIVRTALEIEGLSVDLAQNGQGSLVMLDQRPYKLIIIDMDIPIIDSTETIRAIRTRKDALANIPIIAMSASASDIEKSRYINAGINSILTKPFTVETLRTTINQWLTALG